jgi:hypothetical protein
LKGIYDVGITQGRWRAVVDLLEKVTRLCEALQRAEKLVEFLIKLADRDSVSGLLKRRAFLRKSLYDLTLITSDQSYGLLAILHIDDM